MRICFWQSDLLLFGQGLRLLATCRFAWGSLTSLRWRIRELARAAIFPALALPPPWRSQAALHCPNVGGYRGPPPCPLTQGDGAPLWKEGRAGQLPSGVDISQKKGKKRGRSLKGKGVDPWKIKVRVRELIFCPSCRGSDEALIYLCASARTSLFSQNINAVWIVSSHTTVSNSSKSLAH